MSVSIPNRKDSDCQYAYDVYLLAIRVGEIIVNKPDKYVKLYGEHIIKLSLEALTYVQIADRIDLEQPYDISDYERKYENIKKTYFLIDPISTACQLFLMQVSKSPNVKEDKVINEMKDIGTLCNNAHNSLLKVLEEVFGYKDNKF